MQHKFELEMICLQRFQNHDCGAAVAVFSCQLATDGRCSPTTPVLDDCFPSNQPQLTLAKELNGAPRRVHEVHILTLTTKSLPVFSGALMQNCFYQHISFLSIIVPVSKYSIGYIWSEASNPESGLTCVCNK
jgi:hypothetical protein